MKVKNYYNILGILKDSSADEIKKAYKLHAAKMHPDKHNGDNFFEDKFKDIIEAYEILSNPEKRKDFDTRLNSRQIKYSDSFKQKEIALKKKENELKLREKEILKKELELRQRVSKVKKHEEEINRQKAAIVIKKVETDNNYLHIQAPQIKLNVRNIFVQNWLKAVGEPVKSGEVIVKVQSDHADKLDIVSNADGFLIYAVKSGEKVPVGGTLAIISK